MSDLPIVDTTGRPMVNEHEEREKKQRQDELMDSMEAYYRRYDPEKPWVSGGDCAICHSVLPYDDGTLSEETLRSLGMEWYTYHYYYCACGQRYKRQWSTRRIIQNWRRTCGLPVMTPHSSEK